MEPSMSSAEDQMRFWAREGRIVIEYELDVMSGCDYLVFVLVGDLRIQGDHRQPFPDPALFANVFLLLEAGHGSS